MQLKMLQSTVTLVLLLLHNLQWQGQPTAVSLMLFTLQKKLVKLRRVQHL